MAGPFLSWWGTHILWPTANNSIYHLPFKGSAFRWHAPGGVSSYDFIDCIGSASLGLNTIWGSVVLQNTREQSKDLHTPKHGADLGTEDLQNLKVRNSNVQFALFCLYGDDLFPRFSELGKRRCRTKVRSKFCLFTFSFETQSHHTAQAKPQVLRHPNANRQTTTPGSKSSFYSVICS